MRKRNSTVRARVRVNEFAIEFEEHLIIRWQKNNRAPLFAKSATKYEQPQRVRFLCFQQNTFLLASLLGIIASASGRQHVTRLPASVSLSSPRAGYS